MSKVTRCGRQVPSACLVNLYTDSWSNSMSSRKSPYRGSVNQILPLLSIARSLGLFKRRPSYSEQTTMGFAAFLVLDHLPAATFTGVDDAVGVQHEAVGLIGALPPNADLTGGRVVTHNAAIGECW